MPVHLHENIELGRHHITRRHFFCSVSAMAGSAYGFRQLMSLQAAELQKQGRSLILLWMAGGPSHLETFDPKLDREQSGETKAIPTAVPGIQIAHYWPEMAKVTNGIAIIRSLNNKEGNHQRATYQLHTGYVPSGSVKHPSFGSCIAQQLSAPQLELPSVVSIGRTEGAGFLGVDYEPFNVDDPGELPQNVASAKSAARFQRRLGLLGELDQEFASRGGAIAAENHQRLYDKASRLVLSPSTKAFDFAGESAELQSRYGKGQFGRGCLLARRLVEHGVSYVEVRSNGWDTHEDIFEKVAENAGDVDRASAALLSDLKERGMLDRTVVVWMGEFGRTPKINARGGRDHYPRVFNAWVAGGGMRGGQVIGASSENGAEVAERPVGVPDLMQSLCRALKIDSAHENISPLGRPLKVVDGGEVVEELFA